jgi:hypothetical protein
MSERHYTPDGTLMMRAAASPEPREPLPSFAREIAQDPVILPIERAELRLLLTLLVALVTLAAIAGVIALI